MISAKELTKLYYSISEVSAMFGVSNSTLRYWESEFNNLKPKKNRYGDRAYTKKDITEIERIYFLIKEKGFTIDGAKKELKVKRRGTKQEVVKRLESLKQKLQVLEERLDKITWNNLCCLMR